MIYFIGDVHARFEELVERLIISNIKNSSLIQVGDFGVGFKKEEEAELNVLNNFLKSRNNKLYVIRGNHDIPSFFYKTNHKGNIRFLKDYSLLEIENLKILLIGGAISIDRTRRVEGLSYWKDEGFVFDEGLLAEALLGIDGLDIVVTHNAPTEFWPFDFDINVIAFMQEDKSLSMDLVNERNAHSTLMKHLKRFNPKYWYYGHFHAKYRGSFEGIQYQVLDVMEIRAHI